MIGTNRRRGLMGGVDERDIVIAVSTQNGITARILQDSYNAGWIASPDRLMLSEAKNILTIDTNGLTASSFISSANDFSWFQYLENVEIVNTYSYGCDSAFVLVPPNAITSVHRLGVRRIKSSKIVLLQRTPIPIFYTYPATNYTTTIPRCIENTNSTFYVPDDSYNDWLPYIEAAANSPSWTSSTGITCARISDLTAEEQARIKIPY